MAAIFETGIQQVSTVTNSAGVIWDTDNTSATAYGPLGAIAAGDVLKDLLIVNQGSVTVYVGGASVTASTGTPVAAGGSMLLQGYSVTSVASSSNGDISAITSSGTAQVTVGLASVLSVV